MKLFEMTCQQPKTSDATLSSTQARELLSETPGWTLGEKTLTREFSFHDFREAMEFVKRVATLAEQQNHHPDLHISYKKVNLTLTTHKIGGLSKNDFIVAARIDKILESYLTSLDKTQVNQSGIRGKTALVTGAAKRIGREIALSLAERGVNVAIHFRHSSPEAEKLCSDLKDSGVKSWIFQADFANSDDLQQLVSKVFDTVGTIDFLVNSASMYPPDKVQEMDFASLAGNIQINAWAPFILGREFARRATTGSIVNLLDARVGGYDRLHVSYLLSKKLLFSLTETMSIEFAPKITVNAVAPGLILPPEGTAHAYIDNLAKNIPLKRSGNPKDVTNAVLFLLRENYLTGQIIFVDGGSHLLEHHYGPNCN
ncbi:MAG: 4a-hydroxytetrahydrobiopterin dehydratase [Candidatus Riflebacteria bacterium]|nr:4a-hydroxytetrahydrobiopterin dehydratase [Candidatus Riflebacteria bacterium]